MPSDNKPNVLFIGGPMGSGKTTLAKRLADIYGYEFVEGDDFHSDEMKQKMASGIPLTDEDRRPWLLSLAALWQNNKERKMVIACSALKKPYRNDEATQHKVKIILLKVSEDNLRSRLAKRLKEDPKHFAPPSLLQSQLEAFEVFFYFLGDKLLGFIRSVNFKKSSKNSKLPVNEPNVYIMENNEDSYGPAMDLFNNLC
ncbi:unnamed protein product [Meloidogyne enterolobii]|uniref:Uncharacterized protein n=1 Tax=Meloidogyne enterolobii TaxID=390850 RepID=A0ACB1BBK2_MELEN